MNLETDFKELEAKVSKLESVIEEKDSAINELKSQVAKLTAENKELDKLLAIEKEKALNAEMQAKEERALKSADSIMDKMLAESCIPERLYPKVKGQIDYKAFKDENGDFDSAKFTQVFKAEVTEWEASIGNTAPRIGLSEEKKSDFSEDADLTEYARNLARQYAGHIRSDEK